MFDKTGAVFRKVQNLKIEIYLVTTTSLVAFAGTRVGSTAEHRSPSHQFPWSDLPNSQKAEFVVRAQNHFGNRYD